MGSLYSIGAADVPISTYRSVADETAKTSATPQGVVAFRKNQTTPDHFPMPSVEAANAKYDALAESPGDYVYVYLYRDHKAIDEGYFTATSTHETKFETKRDRERVGTGWILGGVALGLLGIAMGFKRSK